MLPRVLRRRKSALAGALILAVIALAALFAPALVPYDPIKIAPAAALSKEGVEFFEKSIRPVLSEKCYSCHSAQAKKLKGKLLLDSRQGIAEGGRSNVKVDPDDPQSLLVWGAAG